MACCVSKVLPPGGWDSDHGWVQFLAGAALFCWHTPRWVLNCYSRVSTTLFEWNFMTFPWLVHDQNESFHDHTNACRMTNKVKICRFSSKILLLGAFLRLKQILLFLFTMRIISIGLEYQFFLAVWQETQKSHLENENKKIHKYSKR